MNYRYGLSSTPATMSSNPVAVANEENNSESQESNYCDDDATKVVASSSFSSNHQNDNEKQNQPLVDHTYTDYSIISEEDDVRLLEEDFPQLSQPRSEKEAEAREKLRGMTCTYGPSRKNAGGVTKPFPGKLMEVLNRLDIADVIEWRSHGRAFLVKDPKLFATQVLPRFFKQTKFLSFTRQLNLWGFKRITRGKDKGAYYHEMFLRGRPYLAMRMKRQKIKGTGMKLTPDPDSEPDFYTGYPRMPPLKQGLGPIPPLPPLPLEQMSVLLQEAGKVNYSNGSMIQALNVAPLQQEQQMPSIALKQTQFQQIEDQHQKGVGLGEHIPRVNDFERFFAMNAASAKVAETLQHLQQQQLQHRQLQFQQLQQQQLQHVGQSTKRDYQHSYGSVNHQAIMFAAASQLTTMIPSAMPSNQLSQGALIAKRADDDVLLAPGVRTQLGLNAASTGNGGSIRFKDNTSGKFSNNLMNNCVLNPVALNYPLIQSLPLNQAETTKVIAHPASTTKPAKVATIAATTTTNAAASKGSETPAEPTNVSGDVFAGLGNDPLLDALEKVGNDQLSKAKFQAEFLQSLASSVAHATVSNKKENVSSPEQKKSGGYSPPTQEKRQSLDRPVGGA